LNNFAVAFELMHKLSVSFGLTICSLILVPSCSQRKARAADRDFYSPIEYNDYIVDQQNEIIHDMVTLTNSYDTGSPTEIRTNFKKLTLQAELCSDNISKLSDYDGDSTLKCEAKKLFGFYNQIFHNEYRRMVEIFLKGANASDQDITELNIIVQEVRKKEEILNKELEAVQVAFSRKFQFEFSDSRLQEPLEVGALVE